MFRGLWRLVWLEIKIFVREPLGFIGSVAIPVALFIVMARLGRAARPLDRAALPRFIGDDLPILASILIAASAVLSLVTIVAIYREGGILKRLRATPLRPHTILLAHVLVKLLFTAVTLAVMVAAGRRFYPVAAGVPLASFTLALLLATTSLIAFGFVIASLVPTARFAQPIGSLVLYPMIGLSGLFVPVAALPGALQPVAQVLPMTHAVSLLSGIWHGHGWSAHVTEVAVLLGMGAAFTLLSAKVFRWE